MHLLHSLQGYEFRLLYSWRNLSLNCDANQIACTLHLHLSYRIRNMYSSRTGTSNSFSDDATNNQNDPSTKKLAQAPGWTSSLCPTLRLVFTYHQYPHIPALSPLEFTPHKLFNQSLSPSTTDPRTNTCNQTRANRYILRYPGPLPSRASPRSMLAAPARQSGMASQAHDLHGCGSAKHLSDLV